WFLSVESKGDGEPRLRMSIHPSKRSRVRRRVQVLSLALALVSAAASCSGSGKDDTSASSSAARPGASYCRGTRPGTQVWVYSTAGPLYWYNDVTTAFQSCGVGVFFQSGTSPNVVQMLDQERFQRY